MFIRTEKSSQVHSHEYDPESLTFRCRFSCRRCKGKGCETLPDHANPTVPRTVECPDCKGRGHGPTYSYQGVDAETYVKVRDADSVGSAMHNLIVKNKDRFPFTKS